MVPTAAAGTEYFGSTDEFDAEAANLFQLVDALDRIAPGFAEAAGVKLAFAVDGELMEDWTRPLPPGCEVLIVPRIGGGESLSCRREREGPKPNYPELRPSLSQAGEGFPTACTVHRSR